MIDISLVSSEIPIAFPPLSLSFFTTMAEVIGVVSGAIAFATVVIQLGRSIATLKDFCDQLNDSPDEIRRLIREIEIYGLILTDIDEDLSQESGLIPLRNSKHIRQCLDLCKEASENLASLCANISQDTRPLKNLRQVYKSTRLVMKRGKIEKYSARLQKVIQLLMLSQQSYLRCVLVPTTLVWRSSTWACPGGFY